MSSCSDVTKNITSANDVKINISRSFNFFVDTADEMLKLLTFFVGVPRSFDEKY